MSFRICTECKDLFDDGWYIGDYNSYFCSKDCLEKNITWEEYLVLHDDGDGDAYWSYWWDEGFNEDDLEKLYEYAAKGKINEVTSFIENRTEEDYYLALNYLKIKGVNIA